jgi:hypothetical protein
MKITKETIMKIWASMPHKQRNDEFNADINEFSTKTFTLNFNITQSEFIKFVVEKNNGSRIYMIKMPK